MKRFFLICVLLSIPFFKGYSQNGWMWQNPLPQGNALNDVIMFDANTAIAVGDGGTIMKTSDGGSNWDLLNSGTNDDLNAVCFVSQNTGWVVGDNNTVLKTTDGGLSWIPQETPTDSLGEDFDPFDPSTWPSVFDYILYSVHFLDSNTGWAVGWKQEIGMGITYSGGIIATTDGGETWLDQPSGMDGILNDVFFHDSQNGWAVGGDWSYATLLRTSDGGDTWIPQSGMPTYSGDALMLQSVYFIDYNTGWIAGGDDLTMKTINGGVTWQPIDWSWVEYRTNPHSVFFADENHGWVVGQYVLYTSDGGIHWDNQMHIPGGLILYYQSVFAADADNAFIVGPGSKIYQTHDGGENWVKKISGPTEDLYDLFFVNSQTGWAVGEDYVLMKTTDGGTNWTPYYYDVDGLRFTSIHFCDEDTGYAAGDLYVGPYLNGVIYKSTDGGYAWTLLPETNFFRSTPRSIFFLDENRGWAVGDNALIEKTVDGGEHWESQANPFSGSDQQFQSVFFTDENKGWIAGGHNGALLHTIDGGITWSEQISGTTKWLGSVFFVNSDTGWCVGGIGFSDGIILNTNNGGTNWVTQSDTVESGLNSVYFTDTQTGWVVGNGGTILKTIDGGTAWTEEQSHSANDLQSIFASNENHAWTVGNGGTILNCFSGQTNDAPEITSSDSVVTTEGALFEYIAQASDPNGDTITFSFSRYPSWLVPCDSTVTGTVPIGAQDTSFVVIASDGELTDTLTVFISVSEASAVSHFDSNVPSVFCLEQNYPNPFNPATTITFGLPKASKVTVQIYNIKGEFVFTLFQGRKEAGYHSIEWDGTAFPSGAYFIKMEAENFVKVRKCVLIK
ncbi:T9SS type A sorting domain-containing protein [bacterium]|nr:T9SS type A sorting domain-containing protein [bacterium]